MIFLRAKREQKFWNKSDILILLCLGWQDTEIVYEVEGILEQILTHTQVVTAFLVSRKCDYLETLQYIVVRVLTANKKKSWRW